MAAFLIAEEGILAGTNLPLVEEEEWILGRDPDVCFHVLADPMVSRKHALIRLQDAHYFIENLSSTNPVMVNGENVIDPIELQEDDMIQIGSSTFRFSHSLPEQPLNPLSESTEETQTANLFDDIRPEEDFSLGRLSFTTEIQSRWMIKVTAGPNAGAEFTIRAGESYILGKDSNQADILFQDLSVSRQHARLTCSEEEVVSIEDLGSRNGVLINGSLSEGITELKSQDLVAMGTTAFLVIDREATRETIYSPPSVSRYIDHELSEDERKEAKEKAHDLEEELILKRNWKETLIPFRHLMIGFLLLILVASGVIGVISLFQTSTVTIAKRDEMGELKKLLHNFPGVQFTFNPDTGELFLVGHVVTDVA
ncbi:MAG: FHA domain-containing protein, partial [Simkaniaceae bacterium]|nr:FHA domain-containing protein [Simkaniaceae bacterium]